MTLIRRVAPDSSRLSFVVSALAASSPTAVRSVYFQRRTAFGAKRTQNADQLVVGILAPFHKFGRLPEDQVRGHVVGLAQISVSTLATSTRRVLRRSDVRLPTAISFE